MRLQHSVISTRFDGCYDSVRSVCRRPFCDDFGFESSSATTTCSVWLATDDEERQVRGRSLHCCTSLDEPIQKSDRARQLGNTCACAAQRAGCAAARMG